MKIFTIAIAMSMMLGILASPTPYWKSDNQDIDERPIEGTTNETESNRYRLARSRSVSNK